MEQYEKLERKLKGWRKREESRQNDKKAKQIKIL